MNRRQLTTVIGPAVLLIALSVLLAVRDRQNAVDVPSPPNPKVFHTATWLPPAEPGGKRIWEVRLPGKVFRIPEGLVFGGSAPTTSFTLKLVWPEWVPLGSTGRNAPVKDEIKVHFQLDPNKGQRTGRDLIKLSLDPGNYRPPVRVDEYPDYLIYPHSGYRESQRVFTAYYESTRPDGVTPEGKPIVFHCAKGKGKDGGDWTPCRGHYRIFGDVLITVDFYGEHIKDGTDIYLKSMELIRSLAEIES